MKFIVFFGLVAFIASCYAACDCAASDQTCLDKCGKDTCHILVVLRVNFFFSLI